MTCSQRALVMPTPAGQASNRPAFRPGIKELKSVTVVCRSVMPSACMPARKMSGDMPVTLPSGPRKLYGVAFQTPILMLFEAMAFPSVELGFTAVAADALAAAAAADVVGANDALEAATAGAIARPAPKRSARVRTSRRVAPRGLPSTSPSRTSLSPGTLRSNIGLPHFPCYGVEDAHGSLSSR